MGEGRITYIQARRLEGAVSLLLRRLRVLGGSREGGDLGLSFSGL